LGVVAVSSAKLIENIPFFPFQGNRTNGYATRVARWYTFEPKLPLWVNFGGPLNGEGWRNFCPFRIYHLRPLGIFYGPLGNFVAIFVYFSPSWNQEKSGNPERNRIIAFFVAKSTCQTFNILQFRNKL
jgi:hypothetical protein